MIEEARLEFRLRKFDETRNYLLDQIKHNDLMSEKCKRTCKCLNYVENSLILSSTITSWVSISAFASLVRVPVCTTSSAIFCAKICAIIAGIKKYKSIIKKKRKMHEKNVMLGEEKLNTIEVLISKALID